MPSKPLHPCSMPGCPEIAVVHGRCAQHQVAARMPDNRVSAARRGYDYRWTVIRAKFLREYPICEICGAGATQVHHLLSIAEGGTNHWDNLQALCAGCHSRVTNARR